MAFNGCVAKRGPKTKYKSELCQELIDHMAQGRSFLTFSKKVKTCRDTLYEWAKIYPEFNEAKGIGELQSLYWWESEGMREGGIAPAKWIYTMRCRFGKFGWNVPNEVRQEANHSIKDEKSEVWLEVCRRLEAQK